MAKKIEKEQQQDIKVVEPTYNCHQISNLLKLSVINRRVTAIKFLGEEKTEKEWIEMLSKNNLM